MTKAKNKQPTSGSNEQVCISREQWEAAVACQLEDAETISKLRMELALLKEAPERTARPAVSGEQASDLNLEVVRDIVARLKSTGHKTTGRPKPGESVLKKELGRITGKSRDWRSAIKKISESNTNDSAFVDVPAVKPLAVPEPTTWGKSGGADAVCAEYNTTVNGSGGGGVLDYVRGDDVWFEYTAAVYDCGDALINESTAGRPADMQYERCDVVTAINYVESGAPSFADNNE